ncbi:hypothetical protein GCM10023185_41450 [Hymenobacter saemangeumensis]|uniref:ABC transmembrane type-1 domain-containing protein n=1 Tax=Hymenobacter saemangeumensis TaxID=1084522 RepID=A0ABP8IRU9_9BACT
MAALRNWPWPKKLALLWLGIVVALGLLAPFLPLPFAPATPDLARPALPPGLDSPHWLGTDAQGRDVLANLLFGARTAVLFTLPAALLAAALGTLAGGAAGFWRNDMPWPLPLLLLCLGAAWWALALPYFQIGQALTVLAGLGLLLLYAFPRLRTRMPALSLPLDALLLGTAALLGTVPRLVLVLAVGSLGLPPAALLALLVLTTWPDTARLVRAEMLRVSALSFVEAAHSLGLPAFRVWWRHALPHAAQVLRAALPLSIAALVGMENTLSFLGIGFAPTTPSWGRMLSSARLAPEAWWLVALPALPLAATLLSLKVIARRQLAR